MGEPLGLRARKKLAAMHRIQTQALELFEAHGFDAVTIEQVAEAAEVSASSVYRYFGSKEMLVIWDEYDDAGLEAMTAEITEDPVGAVRRVLRSNLVEAVGLDQGRIERRLRLIFTHPSIEAAAALQAYTMARRIAAALTSELGRNADDLEVQVFAHALVGGLMGAIRHWWITGFTAPPTALVDVPLAALERGLDLAAAEDR